MPFPVVLKKQLRNNSLVFDISVGYESSLIKRFELSKAQNGKYPELQYVYDYLDFPLGKVFNGVLIDPKPQKIKRSNSKFTRKIKKGLLVLICLCSLDFLGVVICVRKTYPTKNKRRFKKQILKRNVIKISINGHLYRVVVLV